MAKLIFEQNFTLEVGKEIYTGTLEDLSKSQKIAFDKVSKKKKADNKLLAKKQKAKERLERKIKINENLEKWEVLEDLENQLETIENELEIMVEKASDPKPIEDMFKKRIEMSVVSDNLDEILVAGEEHGYQNVFQTILQDIEDTNSKK